MSHIQSQDQILSLGQLPANLNQNSDLGQDGGHLEMDSNTDLPHEYFQFIHQEN